MAERRMFAKTIVDSDAFLDMPMSSQNLYFHLSMRADDDGFINNPKKIQRMIGASDDDMKILCAKAFVIPFESGIVVIKHWRISNYIRSDRYKPTVYQEEFHQLEVKPNGAYTKNGDKETMVYQVVDNGDTQVSIGEVSIDKDKTEAARSRLPAYGRLKNVYLSDKEYRTISKDYGPWTRDDYIDRLSLWKPNASRRVKNDYATLLNWLRRDKIPIQSAENIAIMEGAGNEA